MAVDYLEQAERKFDTFNVGTGSGASVIEVLDELKRVSGSDFKPIIGERRAGDPPRLVANVERIEKELGFRAEFGLAEIVESAWNL